MPPPPIISSFFTSFSLPPAQASSRACVGRGDEAVVNLDVRRCWHLLPDDFVIENQHAWETQVMTPLLANVTRQLGCQQWAPIQADLYKLLLYEVGLHDLNAVYQ